MLPSTSFFVVQLSSMITGWCAIAALAGPLPKGTSVFSAVLLKVADEGTGQAVLAALLLASGGGLLLPVGRYWCRLFESSAQLQEPLCLLQTSMSTLEGMQVSCICR